MKIVVPLLLIVCISMNTFAQNRRSIITKIYHFQIAELFKATYEVDLDSLKNELVLYFLGHDFTKIGESDSAIEFYSSQTLSCVVREQPHQFAPGRSHRYVKCRIMVYITATIIDIESKKGVIISLRTDNITINASSNISVLGGGYHFDEWSLRKHLYLKFIGGTMLLPPKLNSQIDNYNTAQTKERKKIISGIHY